MGVRLSWRDLAGAVLTSAVLFAAIVVVFAAAGGTDVRP